LYAVDGAFEVRLLEASTITRVAVCRDGRYAREIARQWRTRPPVVTVRTLCPRCLASDTRPGPRTDGFVYLRCNACRAVWRMAERRGKERIAAERASAGRNGSFA